jgi:hypothetical protein
MISARDSNLLVFTCKKCTSMRTIPDEHSAFYGTPFYARDWEKLTEHIAYSTQRCCRLQSVEVLMEHCSYVRVPSNAERDAIGAGGGEVLWAPTKLEETPRRSSSGLRNYDLVNGWWADELHVEIAACVAPFMPKVEAVQLVKQNQAAYEALDSMLILLASSRVSPEKRGRAIVDLLKMFGAASG